MALSVEQPGPAVVHSLLAESGVQATTVVVVGEGRTSVTYVVDDRWIVQFPRFDSAVEAARVQVRLMPLVQACVSFAVPVPTVLGEYDSRPVMWYRKVPGRALRLGDQWRELAPMLRALHRVPTEQASTVLDVAGTAAEWYSGYAQFRTQLDESLTSSLPHELQQRVAAEYDRFLAEAGEFNPVLIHSDLAVEHIMIDPDAGRPTGLIDFDWASIGDPALDYVGLLTALGPQAVSDLSHATGEQISWRRLLFYWWLNPCYALIYAGPYLDQETRQHGISTLRTRLERLPTLQNQIHTSH